MDGRSINVGQADARYKFTSKERDTETGNDYFGARYYDSRIGRFQAIDRFAAKYPGMSPYSYAGNNPILFYDAHGDSVAAAPISLSAIWNGITGAGGNTSNSPGQPQPVFSAPTVQGYPGQALVHATSSLLTGIESLTGVEIPELLKNFIAYSSMPVVGPPGAVPKRLSKVDDAAKSISDFLGEGATAVKPAPGGSDLILRSADGTRQIRFDLSNPHGLEPHINIEMFQPRNLFPGDRKMIQIMNEHAFPSGGTP